MLFQKHCHWLIFWIVIFPTAVLARIEHQFLRHVAVFPFYSQDVDAKTLEESWWRLRDQLTKSQRFLVAGRRLMEARKVFRPQNKLTIADAVILGRLLDADGLMLITVTDRKVTLIVYDASNGSVLWRQGVELSPYQTQATQLPLAVESLCADFISGIPYHGFQVMESSGPAILIKENDDNYAFAEIVSDAWVQIGDFVQWVQIKGPHSEPLFMTPYALQVYAEGIVEKVNKNEIKIKITRANNLGDLKEHSLIRLPGEYDRLRAKYGLADQTLPELVQFLDSREQTTNGRMSEEVLKSQRNENRTLTALAFLSSLAAFLLVAF